MSPSTIALIFFILLCLAWLATVIVSWMGLLFVSPAAWAVGGGSLLVAGYLIFRVIRDRTTSSEDSHYDRIQR